MKPLKPTGIVVKKKKPKIACDGEDVEKLEPLCIAVGLQNGAAARESHLAVP